MLKEIKINNRIIGSEHPPYIIAEISGNHNGDINRAKNLIRVAKESGACAVKLQTYTADSLTIESDSDEFIIKEGTKNIPDSNFLGFSKLQLYEMYVPRNFKSLERFYINKTFYPIGKPSK